MAATLHARSPCWAKDLVAAGPGGDIGQQFTVVFEREPEGGLHGFCPALKGCHSEGDTIEEAVENVRDAIEAYLESLAANGKPIPVENLLFKPVEVAV
ncbi:MAG: type II toxin-antitoxin system HicB family antitoxin [Pirellulales bacterium]